MGILHPGRTEGGVGPGRECSPSVAARSRKPGFSRRSRQRGRRKCGFFQRRWRQGRPQKAAGVSRRRILRADEGYILLDGIIALLIAAIGFGSALGAVSKYVESSAKFQREAREVIVSGNEMYRWPEMEE